MGGGGIYTVLPRWMQCQIRVCVSTVVAEIECLASTVKPQYLEHSREINVTYGSLRKLGVQNNLREMDFHLTSNKLIFTRAVSKAVFLLSDRLYLSIACLARQ